MPFLKWPGGKRWFVNHYAHVFPKTFGRYFEPFLGGGSVFFHLQPDKAFLGDTNEELISSYRGLRNCWQEARSLLERHSRKHDEEHYYSVRNQKPSALTERVARMVYLNRTCFNGIYRVNRNGTFNVPKGTRNTVLLDTDDFATTARVLRRAKIRKVDFEVLINEAKKDDLIFADPPYTVRHNCNAFVKYNEKLFSWEDQVRLAAALTRAKGRGVHIVSTNANHLSVRKLYRPAGFRLRTISRFSGISADPESRRQYQELLILSQ